MFPFKCNYVNAEFYKKEYISASEWRSGMKEKGKFGKIIFALLCIPLASAYFLLSREGSDSLPSNSVVPFH